MILHLATRRIQLAYFDKFRKKGTRDCIQRDMRGSDVPKE